MRAFVLSCIIVLCCGGYATAKPANLLSNPNFDQSTDQATPEYWRGGNGDMVASDISDVPKGAKQSMRVLVQTVARGYGEVGQRVSVKSGSIYTLAGSIKSTKPGLAFYQIKLFAGKTELRRITSDKSGRDWKAVNVKFNTDQADAIQVLCRYTRTPNDKGQTAWFAHVNLVETPPAPPAAGQVQAVPTFHSIGVTVPYTGDPSAQSQCRARYRLKGDTSWRDAADMVRCPADHEFRGSLVNLQPDSEYEIECQLWDAKFNPQQPMSVKTVAAKTWPLNVPIARTVHLPAGVSNQPLVISDKGSADGWILYTTAEDSPSTLDAGTEVASAIVIRDAAYVIVENITIRGGATNAIYIGKSNHIRIRRCDIAGYGNPGTPNENLKHGLYADADGKLINDNAGVYVGPGSSLVVVEGNFIHAPRGTSNSWEHGHPAGPQGVILSNTDGNNVVMNNDIIGNEQHWWNDAIESRFNKNVNGGPYRDTDINGNVLTFSNDDSVELDGGQINVRFFNNWSQWTYCGISCAPNRSGPSYVYRNLFVMTGDERGRTNFVFKMGGNQFPQPGVTYLWNNTAISDGAGLSTGHFGRGGTPIIARNNIYACGYMRLTGDIDANYDLDYDMLPPGMLDADQSMLEKHAVTAEPAFTDAHAGDYRLPAGDAAIDAGVKLPMITEDFTGAAPDIGAFEVGHVDANFPVRSAAMSALPLMTHLSCTAGGESTSTEIRLTIAKNLGSRWTARPNSDWLVCEPAGGQIDGSTQTVRLKLADTKRDVRRYRGAVTFRTDAGYCRTVLVDLRMHHPHPFALDLEAESGQIIGAFELLKDPTASGGVYITCKVAGVPKGGADSPAKVAFDFDVPADGVYYVAARCMSPSPRALNKDSFFAAMDDQPALRWNLLHSGSHQWHWMMVDSSRAFPNRYELTKGRHTFYIMSREPEAQLDVIRITNEPFVDP